MPITEAIFTYFIRQGVTRASSLSFEECKYCYGNALQDMNLSKQERLGLVLLMVLVYSGPVIGILLLVERGLVFTRRHYCDCLPSFSQMSSRGVCQSYGLSRMS
jgi:hypothetical protein